MQDRIDEFTDAMVWFGVALTGLAPIILGIELVEWIAFGEWPGWSVEDGLLFIGLDEPLAHFDLIQFCLDIATDLPLALGLYLTGLSVFLGAFKVAAD